MYPVEPLHRVETLNIRSYLASDFSLTDFPINAKILDIGCGNGTHLRQLVAKGYLGFGIEPDKQKVSQLQSEGLKVETGFAENLPYPSNSIEAILCSVVIPYTNESKAIAEWARVLVAGGTVKASYHGFGYGLRLMFRSKGVKVRVYGLRMLLNTLVYRLAGIRMPFWLGDTLCQSEKRLQYYYSRFGFRLLDTAKNQKLFMGQPVFIYHSLVKDIVDNTAAAQVPGVEDIQQTNIA